MTIPGGRFVVVALKEGGRAWSLKGFYGFDIESRDMAKFSGGNDWHMVGLG